MDFMNEILPHIVKELEREGVPSDSYKLYNSADIDALEQLISSFDGEFLIQFYVQDVCVKITQDDIQVEE